jgi:hypothetical protein
MALWVLISATLFKRAVLVLWHALLFGLGFFPPFFFYAWWHPLLFLVRIESDFRSIVESSIHAMSDADHVDAHDAGCDFLLPVL